MASISNTFTNVQGTGFESIAKASQSLSKKTIQANVPTPKERSLRSDNDNLQKINDRLETENRSLNQENTSLKSANTALEQEINQISSQDYSANQGVELYRQLDSNTNKNNQPAVAERVKTSTARSQQFQERNVAESNTKTTSSSAAAGVSSYIANLGGVGISGSEFNAFI